jgi:hypothetical protein
MFINNRGTSGPTLCGSSPTQAIPSRLCERSAWRTALTEGLHGKRRAHDDDAISLSYIFWRHFKKLRGQWFSVPVAQY